MNERSDYNAFIERLKKSDDEFRAESTQKRHDVFELIQP